jgi:Mg2+ and Co2+ transporter CorA
MELDPAALSSLSSALGELADRVTVLAEGYQGSPRQDVASDLFDVERHLKAAHRRLSSLLSRL